LYQSNYSFRFISISFYLIKSLHSIMGPNVNAGAEAPDEVVTPNDDVEQQEEKSMAMHEEPEGVKKYTTSSQRDMEDTRTKDFVVYVAVTAALGGLIFGYDIGGAGATFVMAGFREHFNWDCPPGVPTCEHATQNQEDLEKGLINGLFGAGAAVGALLAPLIFNNYGRKLTLGLGALLFIIGAALQAGAVNIVMLYVPRLISGAGIGMLSMCSPVYIAELAPEHRRGQLATLWQLAITTGIVLVSILNIWLAEWSDGWRVSYGGNILFAVILLGLLTKMPESPHFLVGKHRHDEAKEALAMVRFEDQVEWELEQLEMEVKMAEDRGEAGWSEVFDNSNNRMGYRMFIGCSLQSLQQLSGINAIMFYAPVILENFFGSAGSIYGALALNIVNFFSTFITIFTVERWGRVMILFTGAIIMCVSLIPNAILSSLPETNGIGVGVVVFCAFYVVGFAYSWGPIVWVVCAEMFPMRERGKANSITTFSNWFWTTIVGQVFPIASSASLSGCFGFFAGVVFVAIFFVYLYLPETANRTATEIDEEFVNHKPEVPRKKWV
jgi:sugar porter (SP) family MFS transporter